MKRVYIALGVIAVLAWVAVGLIIGKGPQPEIIVPAESIFKIGPLHVTNSLLTAWLVMLVLIGVSFAATKSMKLLPSGIQNFVEATVSFLVDQIEEIAGRENGRRFFTVVATLFLFIIASNWFALLPFFNSIGKTQDVGHEIFVAIQEQQTANAPFAKTKKYAGWKMQGSSLVTVKPGGKAVDFEVEANATASATLDRYIVFLAHQFAGFKASDADLASPSADTVKAAAATLNGSSAPQLLVAESRTAEGVPSASLGQTISGVDFSNSEKMAVVVPFFRSVYSDVNNTLALAICSFVIVEFWGIQTLGLGYLKRFFNLHGIMSFVGILELLSEFIRIISFAFRLFGNIFAGEVLILMLTFLMPFLFVDVIYGMELFVGFIQAAVFALLTLVFATMAVESHDEEEHHEGHPGEAVAHQSEAAQAR